LTGILPFPAEILSAQVSRRCSARPAWTYAGMVNIYR